MVLFEKGLAEEFAFRRQRGGHMFSKLRLLAAQWNAYLTDKLWFSNAANAVAQQLAAGLIAIPGVTLLHPVDSNELFPNLPEIVVKGLKHDGFRFYDCAGATLRLVCTFNTTLQTPMLLSPPLSATHTRSTLSRLGKRLIGPAAFG